MHICTQRPGKRIVSLFHTHFSSQIFRSCHPNYSCLQQTHSLSGFSDPNQRQNGHQSCRNSACLRNISVHSFVTSMTNDKNKPQKRPLLNRFFRLFAVGPKINYVLEKSGAIENQSLTNLIATSSAVGVYAFVAVTAMSYFHIDTAPFVGLFGVGGAAIGFGMKDIANNYVCGVVMAMQSLFKRGDEVTVAGSYTGIVQKMNLRHLELETMQDGDKKLVYIPNNDVFARPIVVHRKMPATAPDAMENETK